MVELAYKNLIYKAHAHEHLGLIQKTKFFTGWLIQKFAPTKITHYMVHLNKISSQAINNVLSTISDNFNQRTDILDRYLYC